MKGVTAVLVVVLHGIAVQLMVASRAQAWRIAPPSTVAIETWNILASDEAPPARADPIAKPSTVQVNVDAPTIEVDEPAPIASGLGATLPIDPYAGATPVRSDSKPLAPPATLGVSTPIQVATLEAMPRPVDNAATRPVSAKQPIARKPVRCEVLAQPGGGFTSVRIVQSSDDVAIDRQVLVAVMHHQELITARMVDHPEWILLTDAEVAGALRTSY